MIGHAENHWPVAGVCWPRAICHARWLAGDR